MNNKYFPENSKKAIKTLERVSQEWRSNKVKVQWKVSQPNSKLSTYIEASVELVFILFMLALILPMVIVFLKSKYDSKLIIINRKKRKGWEYPPIGGSIVNKMKYRDNYILPAFRLPENDDGTYAQIRKELQHAITAETGWRFQNDNFEIME